MRSPGAAHPAEDHRGKPVPVTVTPWCEECSARSRSAVSHG